MQVDTAAPHRFSFEGTVLIVTVNHGMTPWEINAYKSVQVRKCVETSLTQHKLRHFQVMLISGFGCKVVERTLD
jgi:hypothetical protein